MEFHNVKLLPRGLPEIIAQLVPYDIYPNTKVIAHPRKGMGPSELRERRNYILGYAGYDDLTFSFRIGLYPTKCCSNGGRSYPGIYSFQLWMGMLSTTLHEIGHLATRQLYYDFSDRNTTHSYDGTYWYRETIANDWMNGAMARILRVDPRLGQPPGALTGYPGILAYEMRGNGGKPWDGFNSQRMTEWRGLRCGGQVTVGDVVFKAILNLLRSSWDMEDESRAKLKRIVRDQVGRAANNLGIRRYAFSTNGRRYLMFNVGEAEAVYQWLVDNKGVLIDAYRMLELQERIPEHWKWELIDDGWVLVGIDAPIEVSPEQMGLPLMEELPF